VFGLRSESVKIWEKNVKKVSVFGLEYVRVDLWGKLIEVGEWYDSWESLWVC